MATKKVRIRNVSPRGDLDVPLLGQTVKAGQVISVPVPAANRLLEQPGNFKLAAGQESE